MKSKIFERKKHFFANNFFKFSLEKLLKKISLETNIFEKRKIYLETKFLSNFF